MKIASFILAFAASLLLAQTAAAQEPTLQTLNEQVLTLSRRLESANAQIASLKTTVATLQDNAQHLRVNDSTLVVILMQWHTQLEQWKGYHFIHHMRWQNGWDLVKFSRLDVDPSYYAALELGFDERSRSIDQSWSFSSFGTALPPIKMNSSDGAFPTKPDR